MPESAVEKELSKGNDLSVVNLINSLVEHAYALQASDIHLDPTQNALRVRLRVDGVLRDVFTVPQAFHYEVISRLKVVSGLRTDEHYVAQDGRFQNIISEIGPVDVRVSIVPSYHGESAVLRLLAGHSETHSLEGLGFGKKDRDHILQAIERPHGMILATGPTGSGKTTTLYSLLKLLNVPDVSIVTIEDPIEYAIPGVKQIQVNPRVGFAFATGLRSILRQDPNIIMVGEIRDAETAGIAVNTALTGHLLLSTLHTNDAATTLPRLLDMKIEPYLVASTVNVAIGQRLVRKICSHCKTRRELRKSEERHLLGLLTESNVIAGRVLYEGKGCDRCSQTGYAGRIGIYEVLVLNDEIRDAILRKASASDIRAIACRRGMTTMFHDGLQKVSAGLTTLEEIFRTVHE